ncbi:hypothetical protein [Longimicrobium sp.]|uniref:hypothetical protein n=1 Tax=Longimicrobium sp. TaxID=2029185 RepID=UPI003B3B3632
MNRLRGIHPRLVPRAPDPRPSLALLPALRDAGDDFAWAVWYAVWRVRGEDDGEASGPGEWLDRFHAAYGAVPPLDDALRAVAEYLHGIGSRRDAADALLRISDWALERGAAEPAIQCAEAAAALVPESGRLALAAGRANRIFSEAMRAALFYERAVTLARIRRKWRTYVRAHLGLGHIKKGYGDMAAARAHYFTAARAARSLSGEKWLAAQTKHDLMALAAESGDFEEALLHARQALDWYPRHHARFPALAHDVGFLLVRMDLYSAAVPLLKAVMSTRIPPPDQVIGWSTLARATAGMNDAAGYRAAVDEVLRRVGLFDLHAAPAFANLGWGAWLLGEWEEAEQYASRALEIAEKRTEAEAGRVARAVLANVDVRRRGPAPPPDDVRSSQVLQLAREIAASLAAWRGPTWKRRRQYGPDRLGTV